MTDGICRNCGASIHQNGAGRPRKLCDGCKVERYGGQHKRKRAAEIADAYGRACARCGKVMLEGQKLHLDHADTGKPGDYLGFSHADCNIAAAGRTRAALGAKVRALQAQLAQGPAELSGVTPSVTADRRYDPGPQPDGVEHHESCECADRAQRYGAWPSRCW